MLRRLPVLVLLLLEDCLYWVLLLFVVVNSVTICIHRNSGQKHEELLSSLVTTGTEQQEAGQANLSPHSCPPALKGLWYHLTVNANALHHSQKNGDLFLLSQ